MSNLFFGPNFDSDRLAGVGEALRFVPHAWTWQHHSFGSGLVVTRVDDVDIWSPYYDAGSGIVVAICGRVVFEQHEWSRILQAQGNDISAPVSREVLRRYREGGVKALTQLNGAFAILIWDLASRQIVLVTDRIGVFPVYAYKLESETIPYLSTHPDTLAQNIPHSITWDLATMAGQLRCQHSVYPYTYYQEIHTLDYGCVYTWQLQTRTLSKERYWAPEFKTESNAAQLVDELAGALTSAVRRRTHSALGPVGVFLSGGSDSRVMLFAAQERAHLTAITLYDEENPELLISKRLAERAGVPHLLLKRDAEYYPRNALESMRIASGMWSFVDGHFLGFNKEITDCHFGTVLTGEFADYFFKGLAQNRRSWKIFGHSLPIHSKDPFHLQFYLHHKPIAPHWRKVVDDRLYAQLDGVDISPKSDADLLEIEARRLFPASYDGEFITQHEAWRTLPWDHLFSDRDVLDVYLHIPVSAKLNGEVYGRAVAKICAEARDLPNANTGAPVDAGKWTKAGMALGREISDATGRIMGKGKPSDGVATQGSWVNWRYIVAHSKIMQILWQAVGKEEREIINELLGINAWDRTLEEWSRIDAAFFCRIFSLAIWLGENITVKKQRNEIHG